MACPLGLTAQSLRECASFRGSSTMMENEVTSYSRQNHGANYRFLSIGFISFMDDARISGEKFARTRNHCFLRSHPALVLEIRTRLCQRS